MTAPGATFLISRGTARYNQQRFAEALEDYETALALDPLDRRAILGRARVLLNNGQVDTTEDIVRSILDIDIGDREAHKLLRQVALQKFRVILAANFATIEKTQLSMEDAIDLSLKDPMHLSNEELSSVKFVFMKNWCDCFENRENALASLPNVVLIYIQLDRFVLLQRTTK